MLMRDITNELLDPLPSWSVSCGRDIVRGPRVWMLAIYWQPDPEPEPGRLRYLHCIALSVSVRNPFSFVKY